MEHSPGGLDIQRVRRGTTAGKKDYCKMVRLLISDKQLPVLIRAVNRKWKKTEMVEMRAIISAPPVILNKKMD